MLMAPSRLSVINAGIRTILVAVNGQMSSAEAGTRIQAIQLLSCSNAGVKRKDQARKAETWGVFILFASNFDTHEYKCVQ